MDKTNHKTQINTRKNLQHFKISDFPSLFQYYTKNDTKSIHFKKKIIWKEKRDFFKNLPLKKLSKIRKFNTKAVQYKKSQKDYTVWQIQVSSNNCLEIYTRDYRSWSDKDARVNEEFIQVPVPRFMIWREI